MDIHFWYLIGHVSSHVQRHVVWHVIRHGCCDSCFDDMRWDMRLDTACPFRLAYVVCIPCNLATRAMWPHTARHVSLLVYGHTHTMRAPGPANVVRARGGA